MSRVVLFTGKGGVGKTTLAAATAAGIAKSGTPVLVVSTDPAHSLGDTFGTRLSGEPTEIATGLFAGHVDARALLDAVWSQLREHLHAVLGGAGVAEIDAEELTVLPGVEDLLALAEVQRLAASGPWQAVVVDCGPTAETLRLLALPEAFSGYLQRLFPANRRMLRAMLGGLSGGKAGDSLDATADALAGLAERLSALRGLLTDTDSTSVRLVLTPERVVVAETLRTLTALGLQGIRVDGVIANRLVPKSRLGAGVAARWMRTRRAEQDAVLADVRAASDEPLRTVEHLASEPVGLPALLRLAEALYGGSDPLAVGDPDLPPLLSVTGGGRGARSEYQLRITVPLQPDADLDMARVADDLAITIDGRRRLVALPAVLRRCVVTGAESDEGGVVVRFRPDAAAYTDTDAGAMASDQGKVAR